MKRRFISAVSLVFLVTLIGCNETPVQKVQQGILDFDKTLKIGDAFNNYRYFKGKNWKEEKDNQGRLIIVFDGDLDVDTDDPINEALFRSKSIVREDFMAYVDLINYNSNFPLVINEQFDKNKKEAERIAKEAESRRSLTAKLVITFALSLKDNDIIILDKQISLSDINGNKVDVMCDQQQASNKVLIDVYKNAKSDNSIAECIFKNKMIPINTLPEYPKGIEYLRGIKNSGK